MSASIIVPVLNAPSRQDVEPSVQPQYHPDKLMAWIERGGYLRTTFSVKEIAEQLGMNVTQFRQYFHKVAGEDFRTWRVRKRVEHSRQLMREHPDWSVTHVAQASGFNDRGGGTIAQ